MSCRIWDASCATHHVVWLGPSSSIATRLSGAAKSLLLHQAVSFMRMLQASGPHTHAAFTSCARHESAPQIPSRPSHKCKRVCTCMHVLLAQGQTAVVLGTRVYHLQAGEFAVVHAAAGGTGQLLVQVMGDMGG